MSIVLFLPHLDVSGGLGVHCRMLLTALHEVESPHRFTVVSPASPQLLFPTTALEPWDRGHRPQLQKDRGTQFEYRELDIPLGFSLANPLDPILGGIVAELKPDLLYCSYYTGMRHPGCPQVVSFHDAGFLENPEGFGATAAIRHRTLDTIRPAISLIHCISHDARDRICRHLPWEPAKTAVVWHALPDSVALLAAAKAVRPESIRLGSHSAAESSPYFFLPVGAATGFNRVRKNVPNAIRGFRMLPPGTAKLIIAGTAQLTETVLNELLSSTERGYILDQCWHSTDGRIVIVPTLERLEFLAAMHHATAVVYPSRYEGFGLPTLEAMALDVPLIASRATSIPEIVGDAGLLVDPDDVSAFRDAMLRVVNEPAFCKTLVERGRERVAQFTMQSLGTGMLDCWNRAILVE